MSHVSRALHVACGCYHEVLTWQAWEGDDSCAPLIVMQLLQQRVDSTRQAMCCHHIDMWTCTTHCKIFLSNKRVMAQLCPIGLPHVAAVILPREVTKGYQSFTLQLESVKHRTAPVDRLPPLPYHYDDLEPYIDTHTMKLHYDGYATIPYAISLLYLPALLQIGSLFTTQDVAFDTKSAL